MRVALVRWGPALALAVAGATWLLAGALVSGGGEAAAPQLPVPRPLVSDYQQVSRSETPPTQAQCDSVGRRCFSPQAIRAAYNLRPLYAAARTAAACTIAVVDSYGSDTMAHDLHVFDQAFGLQPMCGEEGVTCTPGMPKFSELSAAGLARDEGAAVQEQGHRAGGQVAPGRSRSRSTSRRRTRWRRGRTSCSSRRRPPKRSAFRASRR